MTDEQLIEEYGGMVYRIAVSYTRSRYDADDVYSETFLRYYRRPRIFLSEEHRRAWLIRVTVNCAKDFLSSRSADCGIDEVQIAADDSLNDERMDVQEAIRRLDPQSAAAVYLFYYEERTVAQIADALGTTEGAVKMRLKRAREKLKAYLLPPA